MLKYSTRINTVHVLLSINTVLLYLGYFGKYQYKCTLVRLCPPARPQPTAGQPWPGPTLAMQASEKNECGSWVAALHTIYVPAVGQQLAAVDWPSS